MEPLEKLEKILKKAGKNGYRKSDSYYVYTNNGSVLIGKVNPPSVVKNYQLNEIIFSHEFAKAFFGIKEFEKEIGGVWCDGDKIASDLENLQDGINSVDDNQLEALKKYGFTMVSSFKTFDTYNNKYIGDWKYHLQQMVLEEEPLRYLEKFL